jgi:ribosome-interacting GTPase 1
MKENIARSHRIDAHITEDLKEFGKKVDVLVVGLPQSGMSTLLSWMTQSQKPPYHDR